MTPEQKIAALEDHVGRLMRERVELIEALYDMACQHLRGAWPASQGNKQNFGTDCCGGNAVCLRALATAGKVRLVDDDGGRVVEAEDVKVEPEGGA